MNFFCVKDLFGSVNLDVLGRSLMVKKNDGIKESTDSSTIEDEDTKGKVSQLLLCFGH